MTRAIFFKLDQNYQQNWSARTKNFSDNFGLWPKLSRTKFPVTVRFGSGNPPLFIKRLANGRVPDIGVSPHHPAMLNFLSGSFAGKWLLSARSSQSGLKTIIGFTTRCCVLCEDREGRQNNEPLSWWCRNGFSNWKGAISSMKVSVAMKLLSDIRFLARQGVPLRSDDTETDSNFNSCYNLEVKTMINTTLA